jgi:PleD family two-component response regulator
VQFSIGITSWKPGMDWQAMYLVADKALYIDKRRRHAGRKAVGQAPA